MYKLSFEVICRYRKLKKWLQLKFTQYAVASYEMEYRWKYIISSSKLSQTHTNTISVQSHKSNWSYLQAVILLIVLRLLILNNLVQTICKLCGIKWSEVVRATQCIISTIVVFAWMKMNKANEGKKSANDREIEKRSSGVQYTRTLGIPFEL